MKKTGKLLGIIALLVIITGFVTISCEHDSNGNGCTHEWGNWQEKNEEMERECSKCGEKETKPKENDCENHEWSLWQVKSAVEMERECSECKDKQTTTTLNGFTENTHAFLIGLGCGFDEVYDDTVENYHVGYNDVSEDDFIALTEWLEDQGFKIKVELYFGNASGRGYGLEFNHFYFDHNNSLGIQFWVMPLPPPAVAEWAETIKDFLIDEGATFDEQRGSGEEFLYDFSDVTDDMVNDLFAVLGLEGFEWHDIFGVEVAFGHGLRISLLYQIFGANELTVSISLFTPPELPPAFAEWAVTIKDFMEEEGADFDYEINQIISLQQIQYYFSNVNLTIFQALYDMLEDNDFYMINWDTNWWLAIGNEINIEIRFLNTEEWAIQVIISIPTGGAG